MDLLRGEVEGETLFHPAGGELDRPVGVAYLAQAAGLAEKSKQQKTQTHIDEGGRRTKPLLNSSCRHVALTPLLQM